MQFNVLHTFWQRFIEPAADVREFQEKTEGQAFLGSRSQEQT